MLKDIRFHLEKDENKQAVLEKQLAERITHMRNKNINAFQRSIPSLLHYVQSKASHLSIFSNKLGEYNIVDYGQGRVLYGLEPEHEVRQHLSLFCQHAPYVAFDGLSPVSLTDSESNSIDKLDAFRIKQKNTALPEEVDVLVVFGCGLGKHIKMLLDSYHIKHLIVYEPEDQYFSCSTLVEDWKEVLDKANAKGTALYFQLEKDGRDLLSDIQELSASIDFEGFYFYQHYNHPIFDALSTQLSTRSWSELLEHGFSLNVKEQASNYVPTWTSAFDINNWEKVDELEAKREKNLQAFKHYFPNIYKDFESFTPSHWFPYLTEDGEVNLVKKQQLVNWYYHSPRDEGVHNYELFRDYPNKDGLILGYTGEKLKHYLHYKFVAKTQKFLEEKEEQDSLPEQIKSLILFGMGCGYQLEELLNQHSVEKLFICEPNRDFFHASLYAIDWDDILKNIDEAGARIYLNIGDDGSNLFRDLLNQFYSIGPYILANTYFYQSYHNSMLTQAIAQLREQLMIVISMGEYFDHAYYGINHTRTQVSLGTPFLEKKASKLFTHDQLEVPIFLVGNGPSLDRTYEAILEWQDRAIIVSCGTALQPLYRYGITPDFHAEIEQNRSTFDWASRVDAPEFLKQISLLSCNGIHPDTCELYKDVFLAFKEGESSTASMLEASTEHNCEVLKFAFPTVSNFVLNLFTKMGCQQIYLFGVDLGFVDSDNHHSVFSGYYDSQQQQVYDYKSKNNTSLVVPGNFRRTVFTKHEFKVSKVLFEQSLAGFSGDVYNTSDGAKIVGTLPLMAENILVTSSEKSKNALLKKMKGEAFKPQHKMKVGFENKFDQDTLANELKVFSQYLDKDISGVKDMEFLVEKQKELLFASYSHGRSLLFYYLYGTVNYVNSLLIKLTCSNAELDDFKHAVAMWKATLNTISDMTNETLAYYDASSSLSSNRVFKFLQTKLSHIKLCVLSADNKALEAMSAIGFNPKELAFFEYKTIDSSLHKLGFEYYLVNIQNIEQLEHFKTLVDSFKSIPKRVVVACSIAVSIIDFPDYICWLFYRDDVPWLHNETIEHNSYSRTHVLLEYLLGQHKYRAVYQKYSVSDMNVIDKLFPHEQSWQGDIFDNIYSIAIAEPGSNLEEQVLASGTRGLKLGSEVTKSMLVFDIISKDKMMACNESFLSKVPYLLGEHNV